MTCKNCDGRLCMSCVLREVHDRCREDCPECCGEGRMTFEEMVERAIKSYPGHVAWRYGRDRARSILTAAGIPELLEENERLRDKDADWTEEWIRTAEAMAEQRERAERAEARLADADRVVESARLCAEIGGPGTRVGALGRDALYRLRKALDAYDREGE